MDGEPHTVEARFVESPAQRLNFCCIRVDRDDLQL